MSGLTLWKRRLQPISWTRLCLVALDGPTPASAFSFLWCSHCSWVDSAAQSSQGCRCCLYCTPFSYHTFPFQPTFREPALIQHSGHRRSALSAPTFCGQPSLWRVSISVFRTAVKSAVLPVTAIRALLGAEWIQYLKFSFSDRKYRAFAWYSNILRYWIFDLHELQNHQDENKNDWKYFMLRLMNLQKIKVLFFEFNYVKKETFPRYSNFLKIRLHNESDVVREWFWFWPQPHF